jgi:hypothetical protein
MLLNRHFAAEGLQMFALETWKLLVTNEATCPEELNHTGKQLVRDLLPEIFRYLADRLCHAHCEHHGGDDEEAGLFLLYELMHKVVAADTTSGPFSMQLCRVALEILFAGISASGWSTRSVALQILPLVWRECKIKFPEISRSFEIDFIAELKRSVTDQIPGIRKDAALVVSEGLIGDPLMWHDFALSLVLEGIELQSQEPHAEPVNRPMFSCCSFGGSERARVDDNERAEGGVRLLAALGLQDPLLLERLRTARPRLGRIIDELASRT